MVTMTTVESPTAFLPIIEKCNQKTLNFKWLLRLQFLILGFQTL